ncbi:TIGR04283 family arsenosugar biosynthesis glycosyltransferase [Litoribrevibacter euphylliae]|uniref:TIGR04283 family arsenosugar biosynthesis glycosyltransferase n=1 Tax=Litoribrevibacter euphylliae TaxID=1834034 RepID=A0ABV7HBJ9_9GAMM
MRTSTDSNISVIIPVYQDTKALSHLLNDLQPLHSMILEIIVVDGCREHDGFVDDSYDPALDELLANQPKVRLLRCSPQRAGQMNHGAEQASGELLWFLHADTRLEASLITDFEGFFQQTKCQWGRFNVRLDHPHKLLALVAFMMNWRSRITSICTGDQGIFVNTDLFRKIGGFPSQPLMEDIELSKALKAVSQAYIPQHRIQTSSRKWLNYGIFKTIRLMWYLRFIYWLGVSPQRIHQLYYGKANSSK